MIEIIRHETLSLFLLNAFMRICIVFLFPAQPGVLDVVRSESYRLLSPRGLLFARMHALSIQEGYERRNYTYEDDLHVGSQAFKNVGYHQIGHLQLHRNGKRLVLVMDYEVGVQRPT